MEKFTENWADFKERVTQSVIITFVETINICKKTHIGS